MGILDLIFPKKCLLCKKPDNYLCSNCFPYLSFDVKNICLACNKPSYNNLTHPMCVKKFTIDGCFSAITYNKTAQKLIYCFKYKPYLSDLKTFLAELFYESIIQNENFVKIMGKGKWIMVPIPLSGSRFRKRGYNQSEILAKELSKNLGYKVANLLKRSKDTKTQFNLKKEEREENMKNSFELAGSGQELAIRNILLVDDIVTTGSTLKEAAKVLKKAGFQKVFGLTLARD